MLDQPGPAAAAVAAAVAKGGEFPPQPPTPEWLPTPPPRALEGGGGGGNPPPPPNWAVPAPSEVNGSAAELAQTPGMTTTLGSCRGDIGAYSQRAVQDTSDSAVLEERCRLLEESVMELREEQAAQARQANSEARQLHDECEQFQALECSAQLAEEHENGVHLQRDTALRQECQQIHDSNQQLQAEVQACQEDGHQEAQAHRRLRGELQDALQQHGLGCTRSMAQEAHAQVQAEEMGALHAEVRHFESETVAEMKRDRQERAALAAKSRGLRSELEERSEALCAAQGVASRLAEMEQAAM